MAETKFLVDDVVDMVKSVIKDVIKIRDQAMESFSEEWASSIEEKVLYNLSKQNKPLKYIVICFITRNVGAYFYVTHSSHLDNTTDGACTVRWENSILQCVVTVYGLSI